MARDGPYVAGWSHRMRTEIQPLDLGRWWVILLKSFLQREMKKQDGN